MVTVAVALMLPPKRGPRRNLRRLHCSSVAARHCLVRLYLQMCFMPYHQLKRTTADFTREIEPTRRRCARRLFCGGSTGRRHPRHCVQVAVAAPSRLPACRAACRTPRGARSAEHGRAAAADRPGHGHRLPLAVRVGLDALVGRGRARLHHLCVVGAEASLHVEGRLLLLAQPRRSSKTRTGSPRSTAKNFLVFIFLVIQLERETH